MTDAAIQLLPNGYYDLVLFGGDLLADDSIRPAVLVSLLEDRENPDALATERRGSWQDVLWVDPADRSGSLLWLLVPGKRTAGALVDAKRAVEQALAWMVEDGVARQVIATASYDARDLLQVLIEIHQPTGIQRIRLAPLWQESFADDISERMQAMTTELGHTVDLMDTIYYSALPEAP